MFREQTGEQLAHTKLQKSESDKAKDAKELAQTLKMENHLRTRKLAPAR
jgi:hypothetical protein